MNDDKVGEIVGGAYELLAPIGAGGQSVVYRARDLSGGEDVAVKVLRTSNADPDAKERMWREGLALHNLNRTPAALQIRGQYWMPDGSLSLVTDLLHGLDLDAYLEKHSERLTLTDTLGIFEPVGATLTEAHGQGVIHRDLKPGNIFIIDGERGGGVRLLDFGFAKFMRLRSFTVEGTIAGSPRYIAPEAWQGRRDLDQRVDVYSMAALLFRCLAGRAPFEADTVLKLMRQVISAPRPKLTSFCPELPSAVDDWAELALAADRDQRFLNVAAMWSAFKDSVKRAL